MKTLIVTLALLLSAQALHAAGNSFAYIPPGASTSTDGQMLVAAFKVYTQPEATFRYFISKVNAQGVISAISDPLRIYAGETPDRRGYGISNVSWSIRHTENDRIDNEIVVVDAQYRKFNDVQILKRDAAGTFRDFGFDAGIYHKTESEEIWKELKSKGYVPNEDNIYPLFVTTELTQGNSRLRNSFFTDEKLSVTYSSDYNLMPKEGSNRKSATVRFEVKLELDTALPQLGINVISKAVSIQND